MPCEPREAMRLAVDYIVYLVYIYNILSDDYSVSRCLVGLKVFVMIEGVFADDTA